MPVPQTLLTKILATVGPSSESVDTLQRLIEEGARAFRVNFSHGSFDEFARRIANIREASVNMKIPVGIVGDLSGPKIRTINVDDEFELEVGDFVEITSRDHPSKKYDDTQITVLATTYPEIVNDAEPGHRIFINDGAIRMLVIEKVHAKDDDAMRLYCRVTVGGTMKNKKGINLPDSDVTAPCLTDWDKDCVEFSVEQEVDYLALSFVRKAADLKELRTLLNKHGAGQRAGSGRAMLPIIAKIEKPEAIRDLDAICKEADGLMVARGDLGVEMEPFEVPVLQKQIIRTAHAYGKPVIVATQMLESMIEAPHATRAEVSDVANAIYERADAVMLSGETAVGKYPIQAVRVMARTAQTMEDYNRSRRRYRGNPPEQLQQAKYRTAALAHGVSIIVDDLDPKFIVNWSELGGGALYLSQNRMPVPVIAISSNRKALRQMALLFGVQPLRMDRPLDTVSFIESVDKLLLERGLVEPGDPIVIVKGEPIGTPGVTNQIRIHYIGDVCRLTWHART